MNATEHLVECYFRTIRNCLTVTDVKVPGGMNRQLDLLAYDASNGKGFHVETAVTHKQMWAKTNFENFPDSFRKKFFGVPPKREGKLTDHKLGKNYLGNIEGAYKLFGFDPNKVVRVWCCWELPKGKSADDAKELFLCAAKDHQRDDIQFELLLFRDEVFPKLVEKIRTANYDDELLRIMSLLKEYQKQVRQNTQAA